MADVVNVVAIGRALPFVDADNTFKYGVSRGGMMTYLAPKAGARVRALRLGTDRHQEPAHKEPNAEPCEEERDLCPFRLLSNALNGSLQLGEVILLGIHGWHNDVSNSTRPAFEPRYPQPFGGCARLRRLTIYY